MYFHHHCAHSIHSCPVPVLRMLPAQVPEVRSECACNASLHTTAPRIRLRGRRIQSRSDLPDPVLPHNGYSAPPPLHYGRGNTPAAHSLRGRVLSCMTRLPADSSAWWPPEQHRLGPYSPRPLPAAQMFPSYALSLSWHGRHIRTEPPA